MEPTTAILLILGAIMVLGRKPKPQVEEYPNETHASPHFKWTELLKSAGRPKEAAVARKKYPGGRWPYFLDRSLWVGRRYNYADAERMAAKMYPHLLERPISANMVDHLNRLIEPMRRDIGNIPLTINSGWRTPLMNTMGGQAKQSGHLMGVATDIKASAALKKKIRAWLRKRQATVGDVGYVGFYTWGVHVASPRWPGDVPRRL